MSSATLQDREQEDMLFWAATTGQHDLLKKCLSQSESSINKRARNGRTAVMEASAQGEQTSFEILVSAGADLTLTDVDGNSCLILAVEKGNEAIVKELLSPTKKTNINFRGNCNRSAVMVAALSGHLLIFQLLVSAGSDLSDADNDGNNCLHLAAKGGNDSIVKILLQLRCFNINLKGHAGQTALMMACFEGKKQVFDVLVSEGADLSLVDAMNNDCLMIAVFSGNPSLVKAVLDTGKFDVNRKGEKGMTPAMMAASFGAKKEYDLLIAAGADLKLQNDFGNDFLFWASSGGNCDIIQHLMSLRLFNVNRKQEHGLTPLHIAITKRNLDVIELLVSAGADVTLCNDQQYNCLMMAAHTGNTQIVKKLLSMNTSNMNAEEENGWSALMIAAKSGHMDVFDMLMSEGADMQVLDKDLNNCLMLASIYSQPLMLEHLLELDIYDINCRGMYSWTPVMAAANEGNDEAFDVLMAAGVDITLLDGRSNNCLILACMGGSVHIVKRLLAIKAVDLEYEGMDGTAVQAAAAQDGTQILELLVEAGAHLSLC